MRVQCVFVTQPLRTLVIRGSAATAGVARKLRKGEPSPKRAAGVNRWALKELWPNTPVLWSSRSLVRHRWPQHQSSKAPCLLAVALRPRGGIWRRHHVVVVEQRQALSTVSLSTCDTALLVRLLLLYRLQCSASRDPVWPVTFTIKCSPFFPPNINIKCPSADIYI